MLSLRFDDELNPSALLCFLVTKLFVLPPGSGSLDEGFTEDVVDAGFAPMGIVGEVSEFYC